MSRPTPRELWQQAGGDVARYRQLMVEHGMLIPLKPDEKPEPLPCGWPHNRVADLGDEVPPPADWCEDCGVRLDRHGGECGYELGDHASGYFETPEWQQT